MAPANKTWLANGEPANNKLRGGHPPAIQRFRARLLSHGVLSAAWKPKAGDERRDSGLLSACFGLDSDAEDSGATLQGAAR